MMQGAEEAGLDEPMQLLPTCTPAVLGSFDAVAWGRPWHLPAVACSPFTANRWQLEPIGASFWSEFSEFALRPHLFYFWSAADLLAQLHSLSLEHLAEASRRMLEWREHLAVEATWFWRSLLSRALAAGQRKPDSLSAFKGPSISRTALSGAALFPGPG